MTPNEQRRKQKNVVIVAIILVSFLGIYIVVQPLITINAPGYSEIGVLGPQGKVGGYPTSVRVNQSFLLYGYLSNNEGHPAYYNVLVKAGNQSTFISNETYANAPILESYYYVLNKAQTFTFPINITLSTQVTNLKLIFELWYYDVSESNFTYTGQWAYLRLNVTS